MLLRRPPDAPVFPEEELDRLQAGHLAHLQRMEERGALVVAGPFEGQPDESLRGVCLYRTSVEETRELILLDPAVVAGRMVADVFAWWTPAGILPP